MYPRGHKGKTKSRVPVAAPNLDTLSQDFSSPTIPSHVEQKHQLQAAIKMSLTGGTFIDTKLYAFSVKRSSGKVSSPLPIFANSSLLRIASPYFEALLTQGFEENRVVNIDGDYPADRQPYNDHYDYESDSDLDEEEDMVAAVAHLDMTSLEIRDDADDAAQKTVAAGSLSSAEALPERSSPKSRRFGRVVHVSDFAHTTLKAFVFYLCTSEVAFKPLQSTLRTEHSSAALRVSHLAPTCSPKSLYRLADRYGHQDLKELCAKEIQKQLNPQNIIAEVFSDFSWRYSKIRDTQLDYLCRSCDNEVVTGSLPAWMEEIASGSLPHCAEVLTLLLTRLMRR